MPFYFRRSIRFGPFRINFSKSGIGTSIGTKFFRVGQGPRGSRVTANIPGTGIFYRKDYSNKARPFGPLEPEPIIGTREADSDSPKTDPAFSRRENVIKWFVIILFGQALLCLLLNDIVSRIAGPSNPNLSALLWVIVFYPTFYFGHLVLAKELRASALQSFGSRFAFILDRVFLYLAYAIGVVTLIGAFVLLAGLAGSLKTRKRR